MDPLLPDPSSFPFHLNSSSKIAYASHLSPDPSIFFGQVKSFLDFLQQNLRPEKFIFSLYKLILIHIKKNAKELIKDEVMLVLLSIILKIGFKNKKQKKEKLNFFYFLAFLIKTLFFWCIGWEIKL
jgi:hypothetical protein